MTRERRIAAAALVSALSDVLWALDKSPAATSTPPHGPLLHALSVWMVAQAPRQPRDEREHCEQLARHLRDIAEAWASRFERIAPPDTQEESAP